MNLGIIGLPQVGKKTVFKILTSQSAEKAATHSGIAYGIAPVRDPRVDRLSAMYEPKRTRYAEFEIALPPDISPNSSRNAEWIDPLRRVDAFIHVVRAFQSPSVFHILGETDPRRDSELVESELLFADLELVEKRLQRMSREAVKKGDNSREREEKLLRKCQNHLEAEKSLRTLSLTEEERKLVDNLQFFTIKPLIAVFNCDDSNYLVEEGGVLEKTMSGLEENGATTVVLNAELEREIGELEADDQAAFMEDLGIEEPAVNRLSQAAYSALGLISFFTVGPDEVRAWPLRQGSTAPEAAGRIHSDLQRGFIRAETIGCDELLRAESEKAARQANLFRLNGKDYVVKDGDVLNIRFNV